MKWTGGCMCGEVRYEAIGEPPYVGHCHCKSCRQHTGAPVVTLVAFMADGIIIHKGGPKDLQFLAGYKACLLWPMWDLADVGRRIHEPPENRFSHQHVRQSRRAYSGRPLGS